MIKIISPLKKSSYLDDIQQNCDNRWGDQKEFLNHIIQKSDTLGVAINSKGSLVGFCLAKSIYIENVLAFCFLATRVQKEYRKKGIATSLLKKIVNCLIIKRKILSPTYWLAPVYIVTATANPLVYLKICKYFKYDKEMKSVIKRKIKIAHYFISLFNSKKEIDEKYLIARGLFLNSAECYFQDSEIPWSKNQSINIFFKNEVNIQKNSGNGAILIGRIL